MIVEKNNYEPYFYFNFDLFDSFDSFGVNEIYKISVPRFFADNLSLNLLSQEENGLSLKTIFFVDDIFFSLMLNNFVETHENVILICIKDKASLLDFTLSKICNAARENKCDILVIDDRPKNDSILNVAQKYKTSYLRVTNSEDIFNYSMMNNVAVAVSKKCGKKTCLFWNCDMWPSDEETLGRLIAKHYQYGASLSGTRLIYPSRENYKKALEDIPNQDENIADHYETIQHAGIFFQRPEGVFGYQNFYNPSQPIHQWRYHDANYFLASKDMPILAVTGAFWIISIDDFMEVGGLNPCLPCLSQDIDFCLKLTEFNKFCYYIGTEFLYHAENFFHRKLQTPTPIKVSDNLIYNHIWDKKIESLLGLKVPREKIKNTI